jgi:ankyrin repeat protein
MSPPQFPLEILLMIARLLTDDEGKLCIADFNSFLKVNRALYACLNCTLWQEAVEFEDITERVFTHLIRTNDLARLKFFLELGGHIETNLEPEFLDDDSHDWASEITPLKAVVDLDNVPMARLLLEHGADLVQYNYDGNPGYSAIHAARSAEMVQLLLDRHADPDQDIGWRPLHFYAKRDNIEAMRAVLRKGVEVDPSGDMFSPSPLHHAAIDAVKLLLECGADVKKKGHSGETSLHSAVRAGKTDVVRLLLERWPEATREKDHGQNTPLHLAAVAGNTDMVRLLLKIWPDGMREKELWGNTPLHLAALYGRTEVMGLLVESWPEGMREKNKWGYTPLHSAAERGKTDAARLLVESWPEGMREKTENGEFTHGETPLHTAAEQGHTEVVRLLVKDWPEGMREKNERGNTPLHLAARGWRSDVSTRSERTDVVRLLVEGWPEGKAALNKDGQTPLSMFEKYAQPEDKLLSPTKEFIALLGGMC